VPHRLSALALVLLPLIAGCSGPPAEVRQPDDPLASQAVDGIVHIREGSKPFIGVEVVASGQGSRAIAAPARVEFRDSAVSQVGSPLGGRVVTVHVQVGQQVHAGDPLVTLDCPDAASVRASLAATTASMREAETTLERQEHMLHQGVGTERERMAAETRVHELEAERLRLEANRQFLGSGDGNAVVLRSPLSGTVISRKASVGMAVPQNSEPIVEVGDPAATWVVADVFERDLAAVHDAARVRVKLDSRQEPVDGRVISIGSVVSAGLRTAPVRIAVETRGLLLRPGMFGRVSIAAPDEGMSLPPDAILIRDGSESVVYVQTDPLTFTRRNVVVAQSNEDGRVQVISGVSPGERVVVRGALLLDGSADQLL
jgi:cobalt-zinc-cadmium efflux system membrane fusion protein